MSENMLEEIKLALTIIAGLMLGLYWERPMDNSFNITLTNRVR